MGSSNVEPQAAIILNSASGNLECFRPTGHGSLSLPEPKALRILPGSAGLGFRAQWGGGSWLMPPAPPVLWAGGMQGRNGFLSLLRCVQLLLAVHRGPVPLHPAGGDLLPREEILLLVHHYWLG